MTAWQLEDVHLGFAGWQGLTRVHHPVLRGVGLAVAPGERVGLIGESGSGKTTLIRTGLGLYRPESGMVRLFGEDTTRWSSGRWRQARRDAQLLFQNPAAMLHPTRPLGSLLRDSARLHQPERDPEPLIEEALTAVGLADRRAATPDRLSGGEQRRAGIARLLLARPRLVVADEPTAGLDAHLKASLVQLLLDRLGADASLVLVSHDLALVLWACDRVLVMKDGVIVERFAASDAGRIAHHPHTRALLDAAGIVCEVHP